MRLARRGGGVPVDVIARAGLQRGEKVLASAQARDGSWLLGSRQRLVVVGSDDCIHLAWEEIEDAAWDNDDARLRISAIGTYGEPRPSYSFEMGDPALLLQLIRERVTASIVIQRRVPVRDRLGLTVIGRRSPVGGPVVWMHAYDPGLEPADPEVRAVADTALAQARAEIGDDVTGAG